MVLYLLYSSLYVVNLKFSLAIIFESLVLTKLDELNVSEYFILILDSLITTLP